MTVFEWPIKTTLIEYVGGMSDGTVEASGGVSVRDEAVFVFPGSANPEEGETSERAPISPLIAHRFTGAVTMRGHGGMMSIPFREPAIIPHEDGWMLTIHEEDEPDGRIGFAKIARWEPQPDGSVALAGLELTGDGADLFFGPYKKGTPFDDAVLRP